MARFNIVASTNVSNNDEINNQGEDYIEIDGLHFVQGLGNMATCSVLVWSQRELIFDLKV